MYALGCDPYLYGIDNQPASVPSVSRCSKLRVQRLGLLDQLVGAGKQRGRDGDAQRFGCLEIDHELDFRGLIDRQVGWLLPLQNPTRV